MISTAIALLDNLQCYRKVLLSCSFCSESLIKVRLASSDRFCELNSFHELLSSVLSPSPFIGA